MKKAVGLVVILMLTLLSLKLFAAELLPQIRNNSCDLKTLQPMPRIEIFGEHHHLPGQSNPLADQSDIVLNRLLRDGANGRYPVASELRSAGSLATDQTSQSQGVSIGHGFFPHLGPQVVSGLGGNPALAQLHGIESDIPYWISQSYTFMAQYRSGGGVQAVEASFEPILRASPFFQFTLEQMRRKAKNGDYTPAQNEYIEKLSRVILDNERGLTMQSIRPRGDALLGDIYREFHQETLNVANSRYSEHFAGRHLSAISSNRQATRFLNGRSEISKFIQLQIRDRDFANSIGNLVCQYKDQERIVVAVGAEHIPGLRAHLLNMSGNRLQVLDYSIEKGSAEQIICDLAHICATGITARTPAAAN